MMVVIYYTLEIIDLVGWSYVLLLLGGRAQSVSQPF